MATLVERPKDRHTVRVIHLGDRGFHGALDPVEGAVWRSERNELVHPGKSSARRMVVDFVVKYVRPDKVDGSYLPEINGGQAHWNWTKR